MKATQQGWLAALLGAGVLTGAVAVAGLEESPRDRLERVTEELFAGIRQNADTDRTELQAFVERTIEPELDRDRIMRIILGKALYADTPEAQRIALYNALKTMMFGLYAEALYSSRDGSVTYLPYTEDASKSYQVVHSEFRNADGGEPLKISYLVRPVDERWRVFEMRVDGIFLIRNLRDTLAPEIERDGVASVIARLCETGADGAQAPTDACH